MKRLIALGVLAVMCVFTSAQVAPTDPGVYVLSGAQWIKLQMATSSGFRTGGIGKAMMLGGAGSVKSFMLFRGASAPVTVANSDPEFLIVGPSTEARDIVIVRLEEKKDHRELQIGSFSGYGGGGMQYRKEDVTEVAAKEDGNDLLVAPATNLRPGEYIIFAGGQTPMPVGYGGYDISVRF